MPSSYSPLKLELIATGEKSNLWGDITNSNFTAAIERAITGLAVINFASNNPITLEYLDQSPPQAQQFRNLVLRLTGTLTSPQDLIVPAIEKLYIVWNETGQAVTLRTASGTGAVVNAGAKTAVFIDGVNATMAFTSTVDLATGTTGILPVSRGGTGATTLTGFLKGDGTNAVTAQASVSLSTETTGTLPVNRGGTGATSLVGVVRGSGAGALTAGSVSLASEVTGTLSTSNGGTGLSSLGSGVQTFLQAPTGDKLANMVSTTGSGEYVRSNSPTFGSEVTFNVSLMNVNGPVILFGGASGGRLIAVNADIDLQGQSLLSEAQSIQSGLTVDLSISNIISMNNVPSGNLNFINWNISKYATYTLYLNVANASTTVSWPAMTTWLGAAPPSTLSSSLCYVFSIRNHITRNTQRFFTRYEGAVTL